MLSVLVLTKLIIFFSIWPTYLLLYFYVLYRSVSPVPLKSSLNEESNAKLIHFVQKKTSATRQLHLFM